MRPIEFKCFFPPRKVSSHKGDYGKILIVAGAKGYSGAPWLVAMGALRAGAGLVTLAVPESIYVVVARRLAEVMTKALPATKSGAVRAGALAVIKRELKDKDVLALGPGLTRESGVLSLARKVVLAARVPVVLDADGLNAFVGQVALLKKAQAPLILTPHAGEARRLFGCRVPVNLAARKQLALKLAKQVGQVILLKGHQTIVAAPDKPVYVNNTGNPGLATGGSGDLLTGIIAAFLGARLSPFDAACCGAYIHGAAADDAVKQVGEISLTPTDVLGSLPGAFKRVLRR